MTDALKKRLATEFLFSLMMFGMGIVIGSMLLSLPGEPKQTDTEFMIAEMHKCQAGGFDVDTVRDNFMFGRPYRVICKAPDLTPIDRIRVYLHWKETQQAIMAKDQQDFPEDE